MSVSSDPQPAEDLRDLYRELILDHARNPRHFGKLEDTTHQAEGINPLCGDKLRLYLVIEADKTISAVKFEGSGCAISVASASLLAEVIEGITCEKAIEYFDDIVEMLCGAENTSSELQLELGKLKALAGVSEFPSRIKCATLAWHALKSAINNGSADNSNAAMGNGRPPVSTE